MHRILPVFAITILVALAPGCRQQSGPKQAAHAEEPQPLLVVRERNPWRMVIGSDSPGFAIYDDGAIICRSEKPYDESPYLFRKVEDPVKYIRDLIGSELDETDEHYELSSGTDQIRTTIWTPGKRIDIYGDWRQPPQGDDADHPLFKEFYEREQRLWKTLPVELRNFLARIPTEREKKGEPWVPEVLEVMLWPYEYAPDESIDWPATWPDLNSEETRQPVDDRWSVYLPSKFLSDFRKFLATRNEKGAVLINGKKMAISYRFPFPGEEKWIR